MATYYWVGGTGTWDQFTNTNWSLTSGGTGGAGIPTSVDDVIINNASDVQTDLGLSGAFSDTALLASFPTVPGAGRGYRIATTASTATITAITYNASNITTNENISLSGGSNDEGWFQVSTPWNISYRGVSYSEFYVTSNGIITFGGVSVNYANINAGSPGTPKIMVSARDLSIQRIYTSTIGTAPNQTFICRAEFNTNYFEPAGGNSNIKIEFRFPQSTPANIEVHVVENASVNLTSTITISDAVCRTLSVASVDNPIEVAGYTNLYIYGSFTLLNNANFIWSYTGSISFLASSGSFTINTATKTLLNTIYIGAAGGTYTLASAITVNGDVWFKGGTFSTSASNFSMTAYNYYYENLVVQTISLNGSTINVQDTFWDMYSYQVSDPATNLTFNAGTSTINFTSGASGSVWFNGGGKTYRNVVFVTLGTVTATIYNTNTFLNLTVNNTTIAACPTLELVSNQTITGTLTLKSHSPAFRLTVRAPDIESAAVTITRAINAATTDVNFRDITMAGAAGTLTGTRLGNLGNNTNITFVAGANKYWNNNAGGNFEDANWALTPGGAVSINNFPLPQDTVFFNSTGLGDGSTVIVNTPVNLGDIDASGITAGTRTLSMPYGTDLNIYGNISLGSGFRIGSGVSEGTLVIVNRSVKSFTQNTAVINNNISINSTTSGGLQLIGGLTTNNGIQLIRGTLNCNNFNISVGSFSSNSFNTRTLDIGTGIIYLTGTGTVWDTNIYMSVTGTVKEIRLETNTASTRSISTGTTGDGSSFNFYVTAGTGQVSIGGAAQNLNFSGFSGSFLSSGLTIYNNLVFSSTMTTASTSNSLFFRTAPGQTQTITSNSVTFQCNIVIGSTTFTYGTVSLLGPLTTSAARSLTHSSGTLDLNGYTVIIGQFISSGTRTRNMIVNGSNITLINDAQSTPWNHSGSGFTVTQGTGSSRLTVPNTTAERTFAGGGVAYPFTLHIPNRGSLIISGNNSFVDITSDSLAAKIKFTAGSTTSLENLSLSKGVSGSTVDNFTFATTYEFGGTTVTSGSVTIDVAALSGLTNITGATITGLSVRGDLGDPGGFFGGVTERIQLKLSTSAGYGSYTTTSDTAVYQAKTWTGAQPTLVNNTFIVDWQKSSTVNNTVSGMPDGLFWQVRLNLTIAYFIPIAFNALPTLESTTAGTRYNLSKTSGIIDARLLDIKDSNATGGAVWYLTYPKDSGNNQGWRFINTPGGGAFFG